MKLALIVPGFSSDPSDWCIPAHTDIARTLAGESEVHVYTMRYPHRVDNYTIGKINIHSFNGVGSRGPATARLWQRVIAAISREHQRSPFHAVQSIFGSEAGAVAVLAQTILHIPSLVWLVNGELVGLKAINYGADLVPRQRWMNNFILGGASHILCGCNSLTRAAQSRRPTANVQTLPLGVNTQRFHPIAASQRNMQSAHFVNVGSLLPVKDQTTLLQAFALLLPDLPNAHLTIAGIGPLEQNLRALASALGIITHVTFAGQIPHDALPALYHSSHVIVQSSLHEGQGMAILEAGACGCAIVGTNVGILADLAHSSHTDTSPLAIACPPSSPIELARAMQHSYAQHRALSNRAAQHIEQEYNLQRTAERLQHVMASVG